MATFIAPRRIIGVKETIYYGSWHSCAGVYVYKDSDAYNYGNGICYIPSCAFNDQGVASGEFVGYTKLEFLEAVKDSLDLIDGLIESNPDFDDYKTFVEAFSVLVFKNICGETIEDYIANELNPNSIIDFYKEEFNPDSFNDDITDFERQNLI